VKPSTGKLAIMAFHGAGFSLTEETHQAATYDGIPAGDGTFVSHLKHVSDGRGATIRTRKGDGWQLGRLIHADGTNPDHWNTSDLRQTTPAGVRRMLAAHDPARELTYAQWPAIRQARPLDGRERDILCRILSDVLRAVDDPEFQQTLLRVIRLEGHEVGQLYEMRTVLETRDD
jgi:hypothetical protein